MQLPRNKISFIFDKVLHILGKKVFICNIMTANTIFKYKCSSIYIALAILLGVCMYMLLVIWGLYFFIEINKLIQ